jgi:hypothetical protein
VALMPGDGLDIRVDLRMDAMRAAIRNCVDARARDIQSYVEAAVRSFDLERAVQEAVHKELERAVRASVEFQLGEAVKEPVRRAVQGILRQAQE